MEELIKYIERAIKASNVTDYVESDYEEGEEFNWGLRLGKNHRIWITEQTRIGCENNNSRIFFEAINDDGRVVDLASATNKYDIANDAVAYLLK